MPALSQAAELWLGRSGWSLRLRSRPLRGVGGCRFISAKDQLTLCIADCGSSGAMYSLFVLASLLSSGKHWDSQPGESVSCRTRPARPGTGCTRPRPFAPLRGWQGARTAQACAQGRYLLRGEGAAAPVWETGGEALGPVAWDLGCRGEAGGLSLRAFPQPALPGLGVSL